MARAELSDVVLRNGAPLGASKVSVTAIAGSGGENVYYVEETGVATKPEVVTNENGEFRVWLTEGRYTVKTALTEKTFEAINQKSVVATSVGAEAITEEKLAANAVTEPKIKNEAVSKEKLTASLQTEVESKGTIANEGVTTAKIASAAVTEAKLGPEAVTEGKIKTEAVTEGKLSSAMKTKLGEYAKIGITGAEKTAEYKLVAADAEKCIDVNKASLTKIEIQKNATSAFPVGSFVSLCQIGAGTVEVTLAAGVTLRSPTGNKTTRAQYSTLGLRQRATDEWVLSGDVT